MHIISKFEDLFRKNNNMKYTLLIISLSLLLIHCSTSTKVSSIHLQNGNWNELKSEDGSIPEKRHEAAFVGVGDAFYLLGGRGMKPTSIYNLKSNKWTTGAVPPLEMHHFQPVIYQEEIYVLGAMTGKYPGETPLEHIYIYNPKTDSWRKGPMIPENRRRGGAGAARIGDKIYLSCGIKDGHRGDHKKWLDVFDLKTGKWEVLPDAPRSRDHFQSIIVDGKLYNLGGRTTVSADNPFKYTIPLVDVFDLQTRKWSTLKEELPTGRAGNFVLNVGNEIIVFGGESFTQEPAHDEVEALNIQTLTWRSLPKMPRGRHGTGAIRLGNKIYTASGSGNRGGGPELSDLWCYAF